LSSFFFIFLFLFSRVYIIIFVFISQRLAEPLREFFLLPLKEI